MDIEYLCNYIVKIIKCPVRLYSLQNKLLNSFGISDNIKIHFEQKIENNILLNPQSDYPILNIVDNKIYGMVICDNKKLLVGPCCLSENHATKDIHRVPYEIFCEQIILIYNIYNKKSISLSEVLRANFISEQFLFQINKDIQSNFIDDINCHNPYDRELRIMRSIRSGDLNSLKKSLEESFIGNYGVMSKNSLRSAKNVAICHICLSSRAAIEGGIHFEVAYSICDKFVIKLEDITKIEYIQAVEREAQFYFAELVNKKRNNSGIAKNILIDQCKNIIMKNLNKKIVIKDIAKELYTNSDYLSRIFSKSEGLTIKDYINREKIELSKNMLIYYEYSFGEIALFLHFYSQSHFIKTFKKFTGITPKQFKYIYGKR